MDDGILLQVRGLRKLFDIRRGMFGRVTGRVRAVDGVSFELRYGETLGLVGESGCGKTTIGRTILRALDPTSGSVLFRPEAGAPVYDLATMGQEELRKIRPRMQMIFQDPYSSLSPRMTVRDIVGEPLVVNRLAEGRRLEDVVQQMLEQVGLNPHYLRRYPHAFSGGQRQRIGIARALILHPSFIVADEPLSALDVSVQAQILELLVGLRRRLNLSYLFISHDLSVVRYISDRVGVMYVGKLVELADKRELYTHPMHPYTATLLEAIPRADPDIRQDFELLTGEVADPANPPPGCYFHPRCPHAQEVCRREEPEYRNLGSGGREHWVACHRAEELRLA